ncbi:MAG: serine/threonine-protein kinase [Nocardioidaceae bacterium]
MTDHGSSWNLHEGDEIAPGLTAMRLLGGGSAYEAFLAFDEVLYTPVVVKVIRPDQVTDRQSLRGLEREVSTLKLLNHPAIVRGFHAELEGERPLVVLENIDGPRLSTLIRRHGPLPPQQLLPLALELAAAAHYMHHMDVVHLDIKPSNIIMGSPAKLIDLSIARSVESAARLDTALGTDAYMAPEQAVPGRGGHVPGAASDMWGIGTSLFHAASGYRAFDRGVSDDDAAPEARWPQIAALPCEMPHFVPADIQKLVYALLDKNPAQRPVAAELAAMVEPIMSALPKPRLSGFKVSAT